MRTTLLSLCLLLTACGGRPDRPRVRIANVGTGLQTWCMPVTLAQTLGYYRDEGLDVALENLPSGAKVVQAVIGGSAEVGDFIYEHDLQMAAEGQRVRSFFIVSQRDTRVLAVSPKASGRIRRSEDLKGAVIGVSSPGSGSHLFVNYYLAARGVRPTEFSAVGIGMGSSAVAAIESGRVDAAGLGGGDHFQLLRRHPDLRILVDTSTPEGMREAFGIDAFANGTLSARQEWLDRNPEAARKLARALQRTLGWIATHTPEEIRDRLPEGFHSQDAALDCKIIRWGRGMYTSDGRMPPGAPEAVRHYLDATIDKVRTANIDLAATWTNEFLPESK